MRQAPGEALPSGRAQVLFVGGASGTGKTSVAFEVSALLSRARIAHALVDGDNLDASYPDPGESDRDWFTTTNLAKVWETYRAAGQRRLVYVNTVSVLETVELATAVDSDAEVVAVLLGATESSVRDRLRQREQGSELDVHLERSVARRAELELRAPEWVTRLDTTGRTVEQVAADVVALTGWSTARTAETDPTVWV
ncbi:adenylyl-sulfate kinase [Sanguibacter antarcticus]|uniref:Adenylylsulfate kinase n=1 Tax=Sanguibacter antarcticus TaxID=372484 RepID=A0A2A9E292_9MICO|nr:adenylyl-sulfate kinase [Sanguibacter antarcticus]PFG32964.1 adenylylsulfate kinase [Sanguibacter antarcticus]